MDLREARARRWWQTRRPVRSLERAASFVQDVGFALLFPARGIELPSLYNATSERPAESLHTLEWEPDGERVWGWKDELPLRGLAWYGKFLAGRASLLSPGLLADLYPRSGAPDDFTESTLTPEARRLCEMLLISGPTSTAGLREALGMEGRRGQARFGQAVAELGKALVVTNFGVEQREAGWPAAVLELTTRAFPVPGPGTPAERRISAAALFRRTMVESSPQELSRAFGWTRAEARSCLEAASG